MKTKLVSRTITINGNQIHRDSEGHFSLYNPKEMQFVRMHKSTIEKVIKQPIDQSWFLPLPQEGQNLYSSNCPKNLVGNITLIGKITSVGFSQTTGKRFIYVGKKRFTFGHKDQAFDGSLYWQDPKE